MADINGIVTIGSAETPGEATVLLFNEAGDTIVASTTSDPVTGAYSFTGLPPGVTYRVAVMGEGLYRSKIYGPCTTPPETLAWSSIRKSANVVLTNSNQDASYPGGAAWRSVMGTIGHNSGKRQFECIPTINHLLALPGVVNQDFVSYNDYLGSPTNTSGCGSLGYHCQTGANWFEHLESNVTSNGAHAEGVTDGNVLTIGVDFEGDTVKLYRSGVLILTRSGFTTLGSKLWYPATAVQNATVRVRGSGLAFPIAGYTDWNG